MAKRTYFTKAEVIDAMRFAVGDERRLQHQRRAAEKQRAGVVNFTPWAMSIRAVDERDFKDWHETRD